MQLLAGADADDLEEEVDGVLKTTGLFKDLKGGGDQVVVQVAGVQLRPGGVQMGHVGRGLGVAAEVVAEDVLIAPVLLGLVEGPVGVFKELAV